MWLFAWKGILHLELHEFLLSTMGEIQDQIACYQIMNGIAEEKVQEKYIPDLV